VFVQYAPRNLSIKKHYHHNPSASKRLHCLPKSVVRSFQFWSALLLRRSVCRSGVPTDVSPSSCQKGLFERIIDQKLKKISHSILPNSTNMLHARTFSTFCTFLFCLTTTDCTISPRFWKIISQSFRSIAMANSKAFKRRTIFTGLGRWPPLWLMSWEENDWNKISSNAHTILLGNLQKNLLLVD
jgi:hypothetical protein